MFADVEIEVGLQSLSEVLVRDFNDLGSVIEIVTLFSLLVVLAVTAIRLLGLGLVYRIGLLRLGVAAIPLLVTVIAASVSVAIAVVVSVGLTVAATLSLLTLTVLLVLHLLLHFLFSLRAGLVEVLSALPA